jgi:hypothetical protein
MQHRLHTITDLPCHRLVDSYLPSGLSDFLLKSLNSDEGCHLPPICIDVASSGHLGLIPDAQYFLKVIAAALEAADRWVGFLGICPSLYVQALGGVFHQYPVPSTDANHHSHFST